MKVLPPRVYGTDTAMRKRLLPSGMNHPAKLAMGLQLDLIRRYTKPGQWLLDPFGGIGGLLPAAAMPLIDPTERPRNVIVHELEPPFVEYAHLNWWHLRMLAWELRGRLYVDLGSGERHWGVPLGEVRILQGDSRHLPLPTASSDDIAGSPPFGGSEAVDDRTTQNGTVLAHNGGNRRKAGYHVEGNIARLQHVADAGGVSTCIGSPPYADSAHEPGNLDAMREKMAELYPGHIGANSLRNATGYGETSGQIGALKHDTTPEVCLGSPPFLDAREGSPRNPSSVAEDQHFGASQVQLGERAAWGASDGQIGHMAAGDADAVLSSPPFVDARGDWPTPDGAENVRYGATPGQVGGLAHGDVEVAIGSPPYADLAERDRTQEGYAQGHPEREKGYGGAANRHVDGYGDHSPGQIGDLRHDGADAVVSSPPFADSNLGDSPDKWTRGEQETWTDNGRFRGGSLARETYHEPENIAALEHHPDAVVGSPPFGAMNAHSSGGAVGKMRPNANGEGFENPGETRTNWVYSEETPGQIGNMEYGEAAVDDGCLGSAPYAASLPRINGKKGVRHSDALARSKKDYSDYGHSDGQISDLEHPSAVVGSPPYARSISENAGGGFVPDWADKRAAHLRAQGMDAEADSLLRKNANAGSNFRQTGYSADPANIGNLEHDEAVEAPKETYAAACLAVYLECFRVVRPGGILVLVTGDYVRDGKRIDLAGDTIKLAVAAGWTPVERWEHQKAQVSFWRRLHHSQALREGREPVTVTTEDILVFCKGERPAWEFTDLAPTKRAAARLATTASTNERLKQGRLLDVPAGTGIPTEPDHEEIAA